ncbi:hypothetical protein [Methylobacter sp.]|uniref:hypothetical protein n=1 Tax=Methylobacter sp. TaxID=2051955 RepID=UPI00121F23D4|nr:hypothetical protein [Methylobacter sp.]TAK59518.1 MAG: hypothetical protein EPO18_20365 [Methylobacter sp.]
MKLGQKINVHETWPVRHVIPGRVDRVISKTAVSYTSQSGNGHYSGGMAVKEKGRWVSAAVVQSSIGRGDDGKVYRKEWVPCANDGDGAWCWFDDDNKPYGTQDPRKAKPGYNWWAMSKDGLKPITAFVKLSQELKVNFQVAFDSGAYEQAWAVEQGLTPAPVTAEEFVKRLGRFLKWGQDKRRADARAKLRS